MPHPLARLRVTLVHDWLTGMRGGEKVLLELVRLFPNSAILTLIHLPGATHAELDARVVRTSFLQHVPGIGRHYRHMLPLMPAAIRSLKMPPCDLVISTSHCVAKGVHVPRGVLHLCYCFTPMRYLWDLQDHYLGTSWSPRNILARAATPCLRKVDLAFNQGVTAFATTSHYVADRIQRCYGREAAVVYPGFDDAFYVPSAGGPEDYYLMVGALVPYKRADLAVEAFRRDRSRRLVVIGKGPDEGRLRRMAGDAANITFLGWASDETIRSHYQRCQALIFPGEEDFGIVPLEVQGCGRPVIAYGAGGALETVVPTGGVTPPTGVLFDEQTTESLSAAMARFEQSRAVFVADAARTNALRYTWEGFRQGIQKIIAEMMGENAQEPRA